MFERPDRTLSDTMFSSHLPSCMTSVRIVLDVSYETDGVFDDVELLLSSTADTQVEPICLSIFYLVYFRCLLNERSEPFPPAGQEMVNSFLLIFFFLFSPPLVLRPIGGLFCLPPTVGL